MAFLRALALVALLCLAPVPCRAQPIPGSSITADASSTFFPGLTSPSLTIDGSELTGDLHGNSPTGVGMWLSQAGGGGSAASNPAGIDGPAWILWEFAEVHALQSAWVWNHNQASLTDRGLRNVRVHARAPGGSWVDLGTHELTRAPGTAGYPHGDEIEFGGISADAVLVTAMPVQGNYGSDYFGLSEIRFFGTPQGSFPDSWPLRLVSAEVDPVYAGLLVPQASGWLGSDVAHSIPLSGSRSIWLFADTLLGTVTNGARVGGGFINSSIGIHDRGGGLPGEVTFHWGAGNTSFFPHQPGTPGEFYWPTQGVMLDGELFIFCYAVGLGGPFGFTIDGTVLIRVTNPEAEPALWNWTASDFGVGSDNFGVHSAVHVEGDTVWFMGFEDTGGRRMILARAAKADLLGGAMGEALEYWTQSGWSPSPDNLATLFRPGVTEAGIQYDAVLQRYFVTTYVVFGPRIYLTTATDLTGPWEEPACIYEVPEHEAVSFDIISYAARPHPELSTQPGELVITYATNSVGSIAPLYTPEGLGIYHPRFIRVQLEPSAAASAWLVR